MAAAMKEGEESLRARATGRGMYPRTRLPSLPLHRISHEEAAATTERAKRAVGYLAPLRGSLTDRAAARALVRGAMQVVLL
eukprot:164615-Hanusia_phi.AAC.5